ncbi:MAG: hypothetical protein H6828_02280 [Planctomycetes bacterium]|nr:hypothetical protein [Planctomycetota bacterium]
MPRAPRPRPSSRAGRATPRRACSRARASAAAEAERGAGEALQLALVLARGHELLRAWCAGGLALGDATRALELELALGTDVFVELAKLRALRLAPGAPRRGARRRRGGATRASSARAARRGRAATRG